MVLTYINTTISEIEKEMWHKKAKNMERIKPAFHTGLLSYPQKQRIHPQKAKTAQRKTQVSHRTLGHVFI